MGYLQMCWIYKKNVSQGHFLHFSLITDWWEENYKFKLLNSSGISDIACASNLLFFEIALHAGELSPLDVQLFVGAL